MLVIKSKPDALNYSISLPPIVVASTQPEVTVKLLDGSTEVIEETYNPFDAVTPLVLKFALLIDDLLEIEKPAADLVTVHEQGYRSYTLQITDTDGTEEITFKVIKGFWYRQPVDIEFKTVNFWLNIASLPQSVKTHQPAYLTALPASAITIKVDCVYDDGTTATYTHGSLVASKLQTIDVAAYLMQQKSTKKLVQYTVYGLNGTVLQLAKQVFIVEHYNHLIHDFFVWRNRLGGFDSLVMSGEEKSTFKNETSVALMDEYNIEYAGTRTRTVKKNSGYIQSRQHRMLLIDFAFSKQRYHFLDGAMRAITVKDPAVDITKNSVNEVDFEFTYSDTLLAYPYLDQAPNYLQL